MFAGSTNFFIYMVCLRLYPGPLATDSNELGRPNSHKAYNVIGNPPLSSKTMNHQALFWHLKCTLSLLYDYRRPRTIGHNAPHLPTTDTSLSNKIKIKRAKWVWCQFVLKETSLWILGRYAENQNGNLRWHLPLGVRPVVTLCKWVGHVFAYSCPAPPSPSKVVMIG